MSDNYVVLSHSAKRRLSGDHGDETAANLLGDLLQWGLNLDHSRQQVRPHFFPLSLLQIPRVGANMRHRPHFRRGQNLR